MKYRSVSKGDIVMLGDKKHIVTSIPNSTTLNARPFRWYDYRMIKIFIVLVWLFGLSYFVFGLEWTWETRWLFYPAMFLWITGTFVGVCWIFGAFDNKNQR